MSQIKIHKGGSFWIILFMYENKGNVSKSKFMTICLKENFHREKKH
jgi:hypothetical protein